MGFIVFIASTMNSVSPSFTSLPTLIKGGLPGSGGGGGGLRGVRGHRHRGNATTAADADARAVMLDLDFREAGFFQQVGQLADRGGVDARLVVFGAHFDLLLEDWDRISAIASTARR